VEFRTLGEITCGVGESPVFDDRRNALFFCDIPACAVHCLDLAAGGVSTWRFPTEVGSLGLAESGRVLVALRGSLRLLDPETGDSSHLAAVDADRPQMRLNDGKVGPDGAFWVGSLDDDRRPIGVLWRVTADGRAEAKVDGIRTSNGLAFGPDGRLLYHADTRGPWIDHWRLDPATGAISDRTRFTTPPPATGRPDGAAIDAEGCYWSAGLDAGLLNRYDPAGNLVASWPTPVATPTMPCFGGPDLRTLYLTTLRKADQTGPGADLAGRLFVAEAPVAGAPVARFRDL
jgi:sugar lactone lactonase YvrE